MAVSCIIEMVAFHPMTEVTGVPGKHKEYNATSSVNYSVIESPSMV
jgi:hypothetical protein